MLSSVKSLLKYRLPKVLKFFFVVFLCLVIVISSCIIRPVKVEAAMTGTAIVGGAVVVAGILASVGICIWASDSNNRKAASDACEEIYQDCKSGIDDVCTGAAIAGAGIASITVPTKTIKDVFNSACSIIPQVGLTFTTVSDMLTKYQMSDFATTISSSAPVDFSNISKFASVQFLGRAEWNLSWTNPDKGHEIAFENTDGSTLGYTLVREAGNSIYRVMINGHSAMASQLKLNWNGEIWKSALFFNLLKVTIVSSSYYVLLTPCADYLGNQYWGSSACAVGFVGNYSEGATLPYQGQDVFSPSRDKWIADGTSAMNTPIDKVVNKVKEKVGDKNGNIPMTVPRGKTVDDDTVRQRQADVLGKDISDVQDRNKDVATNKTAEVPDTKTDDNTKASDSDDTLPPTIPTAQNPKKMKIPANNLSNKFPFSIPFDLYHAIKILAAPPEAPKFTVHFGKASYVMDMAMFDPVATVVRWGLSLLFLLSLIILTCRVIKH